MFRFLFLLFIIVPIIEIAVLVNVGQWLGAWTTIAIVIFTAWLGAKNVRQQGLATLASVQTKMAQGEMPSDEIVTGLLLLIAGILLVTPGFVTDFFGLSLLLPQVRKSLVESVKKHIIVSQMSSSAGFNGNVYQQQQELNESVNKTSAHTGQTIEGEFERKE